MSAQVSTPEIVSFIVYLALLALISFAAWRRTHTLADYTIGGRRLTPLVAALSAGASDMSGWLLLGLPGAVLVGGWKEAWIVVGLVLGAYANWSVVAPRMRAMTGGTNGPRTIPQLFARRFPQRGRAVAVIATALILVFFSLYTAAGFVAGAKLFNTTLGIDYDTALFSGAIVIMAYTAVGGFLAVSWTDVMQGLLMMAALVSVPALAWAELPPAAGLAHGSMFTGIGVVGVLSLLAWGFGYFGQPHILARFMALSAQSSVGRARRIGMSWMVISCLGALAVGIVGHAYAADGSGPTDPEVIFIYLSRALFSPWVAGFVLAAILAAVMSTIDSQLLVASTALTEDVAHPLYPGATEPTLMWVSRAAVITVAGLGIWIASTPERGVLELVAHAWAGLGATFGPAVLATLYLRAANSVAILTGMIVGGGTVMLWPLGSGPVFEIYVLLPAFLASGTAILLVSRFTAGEPDACAAFDRMCPSRPSSASS